MLVMTNKTLVEAPLMGRLATDGSPITPTGLPDTRVRGVGPQEELPQRFKPSLSTPIDPCSG